MADYPLLTPEGGINARVVYCGNGEEGAFPAEVSGQIALVTRSDEDPAEVISRAREAGAVAVLLHNTEWKNYSVRVARGRHPLCDDELRGGRNSAGQGEPTVNFQVNRYETSQNVIATRTPSDGTDDSRPIVVFSGHYDSVAHVPRRQRQRLRDRRRDGIGPPPCPGANWRLTSVSWPAEGRKGDWSVHATMLPN